MDVKNKKEEEEEGKEENKIKVRRNQIQDTRQDKMRQQLVKHTIEHYEIYIIINVASLKLIHNSFHVHFPKHLDVNV